MRLFMIGLVAMFGVAVHGVSQTVPADADLKASAYVNENPTDPAPLKLKELAGVVHGLGGDPIPMSKVSLFSEPRHEFITTVTSDRQGKFRFEKIEYGLYRVVARVAGLCPANIPVQFESAFIGHKKLVITMRPKDIDTCSYGMTK